MLNVERQRVNVSTVTVTFFGHIDFVGAYRWPQGAVRRSSGRQLEDSRKTAEWSCQRANK